jgi:hypothetical protein
MGLLRRLMVPFEWAYVVPPLSLADDGGGSEAVDLFADRAAAVGWRLDGPQHDQAAEICRKLDGVALAIELAAARLPVLGLDGLAAGLTDQLRLLAGGPRAEDRHRSVRAMLDWSHALLEPPEQTMLRRISVFVAPFTGDAAAEVAGFAPLEPGAVTDGLARLAEQSLLAVAPSEGGTRYRAVETTRQYGLERLGQAGDLAATRSRHLGWCLASASDLGQQSTPTAGDWRAAFDAVADDLRAALGWAAGQPDHRGDAYQLALSLAELAFGRNLAGESQQRYEQAATLTDDLAAASSALRSAAAVAGCRSLGDDMYRLHRAAADAARRDGDTAGAARDLGHGDHQRLPLFRPVRPAPADRRGGGAACCGPRAGRGGPGGPGRSGVGRVRCARRRVHFRAGRTGDDGNGDDRNRGAGGGAGSPGGRPARRVRRPRRADRCAAPGGRSLRHRGHVASPHRPALADAADTVQRD